MKKVHISIVLLLAVAACKSGNEKVVQTGTTDSETQSSIQPIEGLEIKAQVFVVKADEASTIKLKNGGQIQLPASAFVDSEGNVVSGDVNIEWQEYHSLTDIMLSGIPMKYDSAGVSNDFVSGGMFTINATQNNEKLELADGKKAKVDLASVQDTPCFNFYELNDKKGDWKYLTTKEGTPNPKAEKPAAAPKKEAPQLIDASVDVSAFPELKNMDIVAWRSKKKLNRNLLESRTSSYKLLPGQKKNEYVMEINVSSNKILVDVEPYTMKDALANSGKAEKNMKKNFADELQFQNDLAQGKIIRSMEIERLGTYNWDAILHIPNHKEVLASFNYPEQVRAKGTSLFFLCPELNATIRIATDKDLSSIKFDPSKKFMIVGIAPDNSLLTVDQTQLKKLHQGGKNVKLDLAKSGKKIKSGKDLEAYLQSII